MTEIQALIAKTQLVEDLITEYAFRWQQPNNSYDRAYGTGYTAALTKAAQLVLGGTEGAARQYVDTVWDMATKPIDPVTAAFESQNDCQF